MAKRRIGIYGAGTPDGVQLMRVLSVHPMVELSFVADDRWAGEWVRDRLPGLAINVRLPFEANDPGLAANADLVISALDMQGAMGLVPELVGALGESGRLIDLSPLFRLQDADLFHRLHGMRHPAPDLLPRFGYGVLDRNLGEIHQARLVAMPGPMSAAMLPVLAPWAARDLLAGVITAVAVVGATTRGIESNDSRGTTGESAFDRVRAVRVGDHPEAFEMAAWLTRGGEPAFELALTPVVGPFANGVHATVALPFAGNVAMGSIDKLYKDWFEPLSFARLVGSPPDLRDVLDSNRTHAHIRAVGQSLVGNAVTDGVGRGGAMGAIEAANVMLGLPAEAGLLYAGRSR